VRRIIENFSILYLILFLTVLIARTFLEKNRVGGFTIRFYTIQGTNQRSCKKEITFMSMFTGNKKTIKK
jgi:hypothetical protein